MNSLKQGFNRSHANRHEGYDWDFLGHIYELRRGFYGGLKEQDIQDFLYKNGRLTKMRGLMGFYCLIENPCVLRALDGWTVNMIRRSSVARRKVLQTKYAADCPTPSKQELILGNWISPTAWREERESGEVFEVVFPSLVRGWRAARKHFFTFGLEGVQALGYDSSFDISKLFDAFEY